MTYKNETWDPKDLAYTWLIFSIIMYYVIMYYGWNLTKQTSLVQE